MVTAVPAAAMVGVKLVIVGLNDEPMTNGWALVVDPAGAVMAIVPVVAPTGTVTTNCVAVADVIAALVPLKETVLLAGVVLKPVPAIVTVAPIAAEPGLT